MNQFLPDLQERLAKEGVEGACAIARASTGMIPRASIVGGLEISKQGLAAMRRAMANVIELEILPDLNFLLPPILAIAKIATMVGLLGTVISMIGTFTEIQELQREEGQHHVPKRLDRPGPVRHGPGPGDRHPAGVRPRAVQGLDRQLRGKLKSAAQKLLAAGAGGQARRRDPLYRT